MCKIFKISRAAYYYNLNKTTAKTQVRYELPSSQIKRIYEENSKIYGAPEIHVILTDCIIHTDQESQYTSKDYVAKVKNLGANLFYSRKGNPYDNAPIESFHSVLKKELIYQSKPKTFEKTKKSLFKYIEGWYNNNRIQKKLGYLSPVDYRKQVV